MRFNMTVIVAAVSIDGVAVVALEVAEVVPVSAFLCAD